MERRLLAGRYELHEPLGGSSWRATDTELGRDVVVRLGAAADVPGAALSHPSIERVFDQGEADGERYAVLEDLPGGTLAERGELTDETAADVAAALAYAHSQGVAHGSLSASAIRFDAEGRAKVVGFGGEGDPAADLAALDALVGEYGGSTVPPPPPAEPTTLIQPQPTPPPTAPRRRRGPLVLVALLLAAGGVAAAFLAASGDSTADPTGSLSIEAPPTAAETTHEETQPPRPTTTETTEPSTQQTATAATTTEPPPTTTEPPPPTTSEPLPTVTVPPPTSEPMPTITVPPPPTTEPLPTEISE